MMSGRKVYILSSVHPALDIRIFHKEAGALKNAGYKVTLVAPHAKDEIREGIRIVALPKPQSRLIRMLIIPWRVLGLALAENACVYHFHDPELILTGLLLKIFAGSKVIYDVHEDVELDILSKDWVPRAIRFPLAKVFNFLEKAVSRRFDYIIAATPDIKSRFEGCPVVDVRNYPVINSISDRSVFNGDECNLTYAGRLSEDRGIRDVIDALEFIGSHHKIKLILIGEFSDRGFELQCRDLKNWGRMEFRGGIRLRRHLNTCAEQI